MRTNDFNAMLAAGIEPVDRHGLPRRLALALGASALAALIIMLVWLGVRSDVATALETHMFWVKLLFPLSLGWVAMVTLARLSRPGVPIGRVSYALALPVLVVWTLALLELFTTASTQWRSLVLGETWLICPLFVAGLAIPTFAATLWGLSSLAPTRLAWAGATAGLFAGTVGATVYALHCPEQGAAFLGLWYLLGMLIPAGAGALIGPRVLRW